MLVRTTTTLAAFAATLYRYRVIDALTRLAELAS